MIDATLIQAVTVGTLILVLGQITVRFFIDPYQDFKTVKGSIENTLIVYANVSQTAVEIQISDAAKERESVRRLEAAHKYRELSAELRVRALAIPLYSSRLPLHWTRIVPRYDVVQHAAGELIGLSNTHFGTVLTDEETDRDHYQQWIRHVLDLPHNHEMRDLIEEQWKRRLGNPPT